MTLAYLPWEAVATFATGFAAVIAATTVAFRQIDLQASQHRIEKLQAKTSLFDLRYRVFVEFGVFLDIAATGSEPIPRLIEPTRQNVDRSYFLFGREVYDHIASLFEKAQLQAVRMDADRSKELLDARASLHEVFAPYLNLNDVLLQS